MKIDELLQIPVLSGMNIIAGEPGKNREVDTVNMMDAPDIIDFLKPKELLVTTAYHLKDKPQLLKDLVQSMAETGCAGLGIKTKRFLKEIPEEAIQLANDLAFPIIELPYEISLGAIVNEVLSAILDKRAKELTYALEIHKQFTNLIMHGNGIQTLMEKLSGMIGFPVLLLDRYCKIKNSSHISNEADFLCEQLQKNIGPLTKWFISFSILKNKQTYSVFPIHISEKNFGFLSFAGEITKEDYLTILTIEQAINVIAFSFTQENAVKQYERRIRNEFFLNFTNDSFSSPEEIINRAKEFSLDNAHKYICAVGNFDLNDNEAILQFFHYQKLDLLLEFFEEESSPYPLHLFTKGELCILLYEVSGTAVEYTNVIKAALKQLQTKVEIQFGSSISFGLSNISQNFLDVKNAFNEAVQAFQEGRIAKKSGYIQTYHTKDVVELLRMIPKGDLLNFYAYAMQGFTMLETEEKETLLETLFVFLETHCQISETAKRLFVHRNTVVYRLEKCEELLGSSLKDAETTLKLRLAFRVKHGETWGRF